MITKELLSEVLGFSIYHFWLDGDYIVWREDGMSEINIYELAHKCKEWALKQGYNFRTYDNHYDLMKLSNGRFECVAEFSEKSEQQSCFNCCQWILENKENK